MDTERQLACLKPQIDFKMILISPSNDFGSLEAFRSNSSSEILRDLPLSFFTDATIALILSNEIQWEATMYLAECGTFGRGQSGDTVRSYGESLVIYLNFLQQRNYFLGDVTEHIVQLYRNHLVAASQFGGRYNSTRTVNLRVSTACRFHFWGESRNRFSSPLGTFLLSNRSDSPAPRFRSMRLHSYPISNFMLRAETRIPRILTKPELEKLFQVSPKPYSLIFKWAVVTGLRRYELCSLRVSDLPTRVDDDSIGLREMRIMRKGGKETSVYMPNALVDETWWYLLIDRSAPRSGAEDYLFLTKSGKRVRRQYLSVIFKKLTSSIAPHATLHHLRHTFAVLTLTILQRRADAGDSINPLKTLQVLMGHSSIESTEIYLQSLDIYSEAVEEALNYIYGDEI